MINLRHIRTRLIIFVIVLTLASAVCASALEVTKQLAPGVTLYQEINTSPGNELIINAITVDLSQNGVSVKSAIAGDAVSGTDASKGREAVSSMVLRKGALAGINADFFPFTGDPLGICISNGELISEPAGEIRAAMAIADKKIYFDNPRLSAKFTLPNQVSRQIDGINRPRETNQAILYTESYGPFTYGKYKGVDVVMASNDLPVRVGKAITATVTDVFVDVANTAIPKGGLVLSAGGPAAYFLKSNIKPGDTVTIQFDIKSASNIDWTKVEEAVGGGPWLVKDNSEFIDYAEEKFNDSFALKRHPRTAVGATSDGKLLMVTVDGRQAISRGATLPEMSAIMRRLGAVNAINLDGGGSTAMSVRGIVINSPSEGIQRLVANALLVFSNFQPADELPGLAIAGINGDVIAGQGLQLSLTYGTDCPKTLTQEQLDLVIWGTACGAGFVNQKGYYVPYSKPRKGTVNAVYGKSMASLAVNIIEPAPSAVQETQPASVPNSQPSSAP